MRLRQLIVLGFNNDHLVVNPPPLGPGGIRVVVDPTIPHDEIHFVQPGRKDIVKLAPAEDDPAKLEPSTSEGGIRA